MSTILVTGGAGYIGSHTLIELLANGHQVVVVDNLINASQESLARVEAITGSKIPFYQADVRDEAALEQIFTQHTIDAVIHFAGLKAVGESVERPLDYYRTNLGSTLQLLATMEHHGVRKLVFSSSATVYGTPEQLPLTETSRVGVGITNPYGHTKYMLEQIITDYCQTNPSFQATILRYFNTIGEDPSGIPNNLLPFVAQVAVGKRPYVGVFGDDYDTPDGTGVRDYIHVVDLARGHVAALEHMQPGAHVYNLGTGQGTSVKQIIAAFSAACGSDIPYQVQPRRAGDIAACYADCSKAKRELGWVAERTIADACQDAWRWQSQNPNGFSSQD